MKAIIGRKIGMTQTFAEDGSTQPVTLVQAGPCVITEVKTIENSGYSAWQLGFGEAKKLGKVVKGQFKKSKILPKVVKEIRINSESDTTEIGQTLDVTQFAPGDKVIVTGVSKGKGFAGTIKRHNFHRGPKSHGSRSYRRPGSIGSMYPQKIFKGKKMAGRMGMNQVTKRNVNVHSIDTASNLLALIGPVPGPKKSIVIIKGLE